MVMEADMSRQIESDREMLVRNLRDFAVRGLVPMFDRGQVCKRISQ